MARINWMHVLIAIALGAALMHFYGKTTSQKPSGR